MPPTAQQIAFAEKAASFLSASTDPFHAVKNSVGKLEAAGFAKLQNKAFGTSTVKPGQKYYYTVNRSTLVAFTVGGKYQAGQGGFKIISGHTDSPNLGVKPNSKKPPKNGCIQLGVACYGGGLWHTWFDRDLSLSGRVLVKENDKIASRLVQLQDPVARVSTLCIHLQSREEWQAFTVNKEDHTSPILAMMEPNKELEKSVADQINGGGDVWKQGQEPLLLTRLAQQLETDVSNIVDFELNLYDTQPAQIGGISKDFLYSARLDNLATVFTSIEALVEYSSEDLAEDADVSMVVCFDHEEIGSVSAHGAGSVVLVEAIRRVSASLNGGSDNPDLYANTIARSFCVSFDQAHAVHPNYASKHESQHAPTMNAGIVIKTNHNLRYSTDGITGFILRELGRKTGVPIQEFAVRNDCPCGTTIGPTISAETGVRTVDAGMPQLSMHSCREVMGVSDLTHGFDLLKGFFRHFREIDDSIEDE